MADGKKRFIAGEISKCHFSKPFKFKSKTTGKEWEKYKCYVDGFFEDTHEPVQAWCESDYQPAVYTPEDDNPIDPSEAEDKVFKGRLLVNCFKYDDGKEKFYVNAVSIEKVVSVREKPEQGNPFKENPFMG